MRCFVMPDMTSGALKPFYRAIRPGMPTGKRTGRLGWCPGFGSCATCAICDECKFVSGRLACLTGKKRIRSVLGSAGSQVLVDASCLQGVT